MVLAPILGASLLTTALTLTAQELTHHSWWFHQNHLDPESGAGNLYKSRDAWTAALRVNVLTEAIISRLTMALHILPLPSVSRKLYFN